MGDIFEISAAPHLPYALRSGLVTLPSDDREALSVNN